MCNSHTLTDVHTDDLQNSHTCIQMYVRVHTDTYTHIYVCETMLTQTLMYSHIYLTRLLSIVDVNLVAVELCTWWHKQYNKLCTHD